MGAADDPVDAAVPVRVNSLLEEFKICKPLLRVLFEELVDELHQEVSLLRKRVHERPVLRLVERLLSQRVIVLIEYIGIAVNVLFAGHHFRRNARRHHEDVRIFKYFCRIHYRRCALYSLIHCCHFRYPYPKP